jgi:hypothetical protein
MQKIVKSSLMRKLNYQEIKRSFQKIECAMDARNWGIWFTAVHSSAGLTRPVRPVIPDRSDRFKPVQLQDLSRSPQEAPLHQKGTLMSRSPKGKSRAHLSSSNIEFAMHVGQKVI